jgi:hypothetical protein
MSIDTEEIPGELRVSSKRVNPNVAARDLPDDAIEYVAANSHAFYLRLHLKPLVHVTWMPKYPKHWCATCNLNECAHIERVADWQETHPPPVME